MIEKPMPADAKPLTDRRSSDAVGLSDAVRRRRLRFRCWHRGTKEADLLLGSFADRHVGGFDSMALDRLEALLERSDPDIYSWITNRVPPPPELDTDIMALLQNHKDSFAKR